MPASTFSRQFKGLALLGLATTVVCAGLQLKHKPRSSVSHRSVYECNVNQISPDLAKRFVTWWIQTGLDYSEKTEKQSHLDASGWLLPTVEPEFRRTFWSSPEHGKIEYVPTYVWPPIAKDSYTAQVGVSAIWINKSNLTCRESKVTFEVIREPMGLRISKFKIDNKPQSSATSKFVSDTKKLQKRV